MNIFQWKNKKTLKITKKNWDCLSVSVFFVCGYIYICVNKNNMNERNDNIYVYLWEEFNTVYVGRTINPKLRHYQHRNRENEKTYKFSNEHHVEHPKMIIIENDLTIEEGVEREKYWIKYYIENTNYEVLNKTCGGQPGKKKIHTDDEIKSRRKKYYQNNREKLLEYKKKYRSDFYNQVKEKEKEYSRKYYQNNKEKKKKYKEEHKEELKIKRKLYYQRHKNRELKIEK